MRRFYLLLPFVAFPVVAPPAVAQDKEELCSVSAGIAGSAVEARAAGKKQKQAIRTITVDLDEEAGNYAAAVEPIVAWVYTLPEEQLTDEVAKSYEAACLEQ